MNKLPQQSLVALGILALSLLPAFAGSTEFIEKMPPLSADTVRPGAMSWVKPGADAAKYTRVMIEPVTVFISQNSDYKGLDANELKALTDGFYKTFTRTLEPEVPVINSAGEGVLYMRAALTDVKLARKKRGVLGYTPIGLVANNVKEAAGQHISLENAVLEVEALDSVTGERIAVLVDKIPDTMGSGQFSWKTIDAAFGFLAERVKSRLYSPK